MYPVLLDFGGFRLHSYGVAVAVALVVTIWLARREARRKGFAPDMAEDLAIRILVVGFLGARLAYVLGWEPQLLWSDPLGVVAIWRGGLALHGGLVAGLAAGFWLCHRRGLSPWRLADALAPVLALGQAIGRLGCFLSGDSYGRPTGVAWSVTFTDPASLAPLGIPLHPVQLYEAALDLTLFAVLWFTRRRPASDGRQFLVYAAGYAVIRLFTEVFRGDRLEIALGLSLLQVVSLGVLGAALDAAAVRTSRPPRRQSAT